MGRSIPIEEVVEPHPHNRRRPSIAVTHPHLNPEWYHEKNCGFGPEDFSYGSDVAPWWRCSRKHVWQASIQLRASRGHNCPYCSARRVSPDNCLATLVPAVAREWHPSKNDGLKPTDFAAYSSQLAWWLCADCGNEWQAIICNRTSGGDRCYRCARNTLDLRNYSYALPYFDRKRNGDLDPTWLTMKMEIHWRCPKGRDHLWSQTFTKKCSEERFCPFCNNRRLSKTNSLSKLYPNLVREWHPKRNGKLTPEMVIATGGTPVWWLCAKCNHTWQTPVQARSSGGNGCPECWKSQRSEVMKEVGLRLRIAPELQAKVLKMFNQDVSQNEIARKLGLNRKTVHRVLVREQLLDG